MKRPIIKPKLNLTDKIIEIGCCLLLIILWCFVLINYNKLPNIIPTHYNALGKVDDYGNKITIITLPLIATILFIVMTVMNKYPHMYNYPTKITEENAYEQYSFATKLIRYLKLIVIIIFSMLAYATITKASSQNTELGKWFLPLTLVLIFAPLVFYIVKLMMIKK